MLLPGLLGLLAAQATPRALLVGVSELVNQPAALWLQAPRNDVILMRDALQAQGFAAADITVLADGVPGAVLPDAARIHDALGRLLAQSRSGDFVLLYFSGHGTRLRDAAKRYQEPDGLAEQFLARDVRGLPGSSAGSVGALGGGLRDVDVDRWLQAFLARNVFVASIFDTCAATSMTRGAAAASQPVVEGPPDDEVRFRGVRIDQLAAAGNGDASAAPPDLPAAATVPRARAIAFFASESHQVTPELRLPRHARGAQPQGLLTWAVVQALQRRPATWRALFDGVLAQYPPIIQELEARFPARELPSPVAEGNLDAPLFANAAAPAVARPVWAAQRSGERLAMRAGLLDGLVPQQPLRVSATLDDGTVRSALAGAEQVDLAGTQLPVPASLRDLPGSSFWRVAPVAEPAAMALRVRADRPLPPGLSLDYPASLRRVENDGDGEADVRWTDLGARGHRLEVRTAAFGDAAPASTATGTSGTASAVVLPDLAALRRSLEALALLKWLSALQALAPAVPLTGFEATLEVWRGDVLLRSDALPRDVRLPTLQPGERALLGVRNVGGQSVDLVAVGIDAQGRVQRVYPDDSGATNRFERGTRERPATARFDLPWLAAGTGGRLTVVAAPAAPYSGPRLFGLGLTPMPAADVRVRGQLRADGDRQVFVSTLRWSADAVSAAR